MQSFGLDAIAERRKSPLKKKWDAFTNYLEENRQHIFYIFIFYVITIGLFIERFIFYAFLAEHLDLRHIMGVGIAITRGMCNVNKMIIYEFLPKRSKDLPFEAESGSHSALNPKFQDFFRGLSSKLFRGFHKVCHSFFRVFLVKQFSEKLIV